MGFLIHAVLAKAQRRKGAAIYFSKTTHMAHGVGAAVY